MCQDFTVCARRLQDRLDLRCRRPPGNEGGLHRGERVAGGAPQATRGDAVPRRAAPQATRGGASGRPFRMHMRVLFLCVGTVRSDVFERRQRPERLAGWIDLCIMATMRLHSC